jgi:hypothetical protein
LNVKRCLFADYFTGLDDERFCVIGARIIEKDDPLGQNTIFHSNGRGIWVAILKNKTELPRIGGFPQSIRDRFGDAVNDLIQPKTPITRKSSVARKQVDSRN